jgi:hypothetical protein
LIYNSLRIQAYDLLAACSRSDGGRGSSGKSLNSSGPSSCSSTQHTRTHARTPGLKISGRLRHLWPCGVLRQRRGWMGSRCWARQDYSPRTTTSAASSDDRAVCFLATCRAPIIASPESYHMIEEGRGNNQHAQGQHTRSQCRSTHVACLRAPLRQRARGGVGEEEGREEGRRARERPPWASSASCP